MSVLSWFEHFIGYSPNKPVAANWSQVIGNVERAVNVATAGISLAEVNGTLNAAMKAKIDAVLPQVSAGLVALRGSAVPSDANALLSALHAVAVVLPPQLQAEVNAAIAIATVALAAYQTPAA